MKRLLHLFKILVKLLPIKTMTVAVTFILCLLLSGSAMAQEMQVKGAVMEANGNPVVGASVSLKGTTSGTITDADGKFSITVPDAGAILVINYVGFVSQEISVGSQTNIEVKLVEDVKQLKEIVYTALGIKKELKTVGYSTAEVDGGELTKARDANAINSLVGKVAGLAVGASSEFMGIPQVVLRGNTDILYVVDGVPINSDTWNISADDVESYTVLKGPNAGALYGSRGINGAILITTKKGSGIKGASVEYNSSFMYDPKSFLAIPQRQNEYGIGTNYSYVYSDDPFNQNPTYRRQPVWGPRMEGQGVAQYNSPLDASGHRELTPFLPVGKNNFYNFMENGFHTTNSLSINASGEKYNLRVSLSEVYQKGIDPNTWLSNTNGNIYSDYNFTKRLKFEGNLNYNYQNTPNIPDAVYGPQSYTYILDEYTGANFDVRDLKNYWASPGTPGIQEKWVEYGRHNNPYFLANQWLRGHYKTDIYGYGKVSYEINPDLNLSLRTQVSGYNNLQTEIVPTSAITYSLSSGGIQEGTGAHGSSTGEYREDRRALWDNNNDILLTFNKNVTPDIYVSALAGGNLRTFTYNSSWTSTNNIVVPVVYNFTNTQNPLVAYNFNSNMNVYSAYYSVDISYKKYFTISTTGREDNSSVFSTNRRNYFYPSASLSTVITDYMKIPEEILSFLKLRVSYANIKGGLTNPTIGASFDALNQSSPLGYGSTYYSSYGGPSYGNQNTYSISHLYNNTASANYTNVAADQNLKPFTVASTEFGADMKFLKNRLGLGITYYTTTNGPGIFQEQTAASTGFYDKNVNGITTTKNGLELELSASPIKDANGFSWDISGNYSTYQEKLKSIYESDQSVLLNDHYYKVGDRLDAIYGYKYYRSPKGEIINVNGLPLIPTQGTDYKQLLGYANPDFIWSLTNKFFYKDFSLSFQFDGRVGGKIYDEIYADMLQSGTAQDLVTGTMGTARLAEWNQVKANGYNYPSNFKGQYTAPGVTIVSGKPSFDTHGNITNMNELTFAPNTTKVGLKAYVGSIDGTGNMQEPYMISKTYAMLRDLTLTYNFPAKLLAKTVIKRASFSLVGRNLLYFTVEKRKDTYLDQYAVGFDVSKIGVSRNQAANSNGFGDNNLSLITNAGMQTPVVRQFGFNLNVVF